MTYFDAVTQLPEDPIFGLQLQFQADQRPNKINLSIGTYRDAQGKPHVLSCVREAERQLIDDNLQKEYLPILGNGDFIHDTRNLIFGERQLNYLVGMQTIGGTGALRVGCEFLSRNGFTVLFLPSPTWENHGLICRYAGIESKTYPYFDAVKGQFDFDKMCHALTTMPKRSVIMLHACCHNPTGSDPTLEQWQELSTLIKKYHLIPFFDSAYQGFGDGVEADVAAIRYFAEQGHEMFVASSYAKNMGLYGERAGAFFARFQDEKTAQKATTHFKQIVRSSYSNPPIHPARLVSKILRSSDLRKKWEQEVAEMRHRIKESRHTLVEALKAEGVEHDFSCVTKQKGMFSFLGLQPKQVERLREEFGLYLIGNGRLNVAGINPQNIKEVARRLAAVLS